MASQSSHFSSISAQSTVEQLWVNYAHGK